MKTKKLIVNLNSARSFVGKHVNVTLKNGEVLVNVKLVRVTDQHRMVFAKNSAPVMDLVDVQMLTAISPYLLQEVSS